MATERIEQAGAKPRLTRGRIVLPWVGLAVATALGLSLAAPLALEGWDPVRYLLVTAIGTLLLALAWRHVSGAWALERMPRHLLAALLVGLVLRLSGGAVLYRILPEHGYDTKPHNAGFFFPDAFERDNDAWAIARTELPLSTGLLNPVKSDQYGGLLVVQSMLYAGVSGSVHRPLLQSGLTAFISVLAIIYTWAFARAELSEKAAMIAAWVVALYPEAVLLATVPMREPFIATALAMGLFGYSAVRHHERRSGIAALVGGVALGLIVSPPFALLFLAALGLALVLEAQLSRRARWTIVTCAVVLGVLAAGLSLRAWVRIVDVPVQSPADVLGWWLNRGAGYQIDRLVRGSDWVETIFERTPPWSHPALVVFYGLTQPLLPAALSDNTSIPLMRGVGIWRALGWFLLSIPLVYGMIAVVTREGRRQRAMAFLGGLILLTTIIVAYRGGGDQWDNPRYRSAFLAVQALFVAWAWLEARRRGSPWLKRVALLEIGVMLCMLSWYAGRYYHTPRLSLLPTLAVAAAFVLVSLAAWIVGDLLRSRRRLTAAGGGV